MVVVLSSSVSRDQKYSPAMWFFSLGAQSIFPSRFLLGSRREFKAILKLFPPALGRPVWKTPAFTSCELNCSCGVRRAALVTVPFGPIAPAGIFPAFAK